MELELENKEAEELAQESLKIANASRSRPSRGHQCVAFALLALTSMVNELIKELKSQT